MPNGAYGNIRQVYTEGQRGHLIRRFGNQCAICQGHNPVRSRGRRNLAIDHDAKTMMVRGLLCQECNMGIGKFRDRIDLLEAAIAYLRDPPAQRPGK